METTSRQYQNENDLKIQANLLWKEPCNGRQHSTLQAFFKNNLYVRLPLMRDKLQWKRHLLLKESLQWMRTFDMINIPNQTKPTIPLQQCQTLY